MYAILALLSVVLFSACATGAGGRGVLGQDQVAAATAAWRAAYDSRDPGRITAMYDADAVLWGTTAKTVAANPATIAEYFKDAPKRPNARVTFGEQHIRVYGDVAVNTGYYTFSDVRDGQAVSRPARFTMVFRNRDGQWRIVSHHSSEAFWRDDGECRRESRSGTDSDEEDDYKRCMYARGYQVVPKGFVPPK